MKKARAVCPSCKRNVLIVNGCFRAHGFDSLRPLTSRCNLSGRRPGVDYDALFVEFGDIIRERSPKAWREIHIGTVNELVRVAVKRLIP